MKISCETCIFLVRHHDQHHCRRFPPVTAAHGLPAFPLTAPGLWCGEHTAAAPVEPEENP